MADALVQLNATWRVADDPPQWTLEQRTSNPSAKDSGWRARKFIRNSEHLLRRIGEMCGDVGPAAIEIIRSWPNGYVTWKAKEMQATAGPKPPRTARSWLYSTTGAPGMAETALRALHGAARHAS